MVLKYVDRLLEKIVSEQKFVTKNWMEGEYDNRVVEYWQINKHHFVAELIRGEDIE